MSYRFSRSAFKQTTFKALCFFSIFITCSITGWLWQRSSEPRLPLKEPQVTLRQEYHPIDTLIEKASASFSTLIKKQTTDLPSAAAAYRVRRGRNPPPGFDAWFDFAKERDAVIIEDLFDQIYRDLEPFWGVSARDIRSFAGNFENRIFVRNGMVNMTTNHPGGTAQDRMAAWLELTRGIAEHLPDLDMAINVMDESRVIAPWEDVEKALRKGNELKKYVDEYRVNQLLPQLRTDEHSDEAPRVEWIGPSERFWDIARVGCSPQSSVRNISASTDFSGPPPVHTGFPSGSYEGYVHNWTLTKDPCEQSNLQELHGAFIEPISISTTRSLVPIFGESKLSMNNDILIPPAAYISDGFSRGLYADTRGHGGAWSDKISGIVWRGVASGGRNREEHWTRFHRHRFVAMLNAKSVQGSATDADAGQRFAIPPYDTYNLSAPDIQAWIQGIANVGFTNLLCFPITEEPTCSYTDPYFEIAPTMDMAQQYDYKILPDIDGNSFSGRYLAFLRSSSMPLKATIYSEWHDDRLVPWQHFVPVDNSFVDLYGVLEYFLGREESVGKDGEKTRGHDEEARKIALAGMEWAGRALRKEDMAVYMLRLLLEYARLADDAREESGFVEDLLEKVVLEGLW